MDKNLSVFTTGKIVVALEPITTIVHDSDGEWQFLGDSEVTMSDLLIVSLAQILDIDPTISTVLDMEPGHEANKAPNGNWVFSKTV
jgi:hypothetical protein